MDDPTATPAPGAQGQAPPEPMGVKVLLLWGAMGLLGMLIAETWVGRGLFDVFLIGLGASAFLRGTRLHPLLLCIAWVAFAAGSLALAWQWL